MSIYLGNLTVKEMQERAGVVFPAALLDFLADKHQSEAANIAQGKWHCFDIPFMLVCGDYDTAKTIYEHLLPLQAEFAEPMQIGIGG